MVELFVISMPTSCKFFDKGLSIAMEMGNIELWSNYRFSHICIISVWFTDSSRQIHASQHNSVRHLITLAELFKPCLAGSRSLSLYLILDLSTDHRAYSQCTS